MRHRLYIFSLYPYSLDMNYIFHGNILLYPTVLLLTWYLNCMQTLSISFTWCFHSLVMIRIDTHFLSLQTEGKFTGFKRAKFVMGLKLGPAPQTTINHVGQTFSMWDLQSSIQRPKSQKKTITRFCYDLSCFS